MPGVIMIAHKAKVPVFYAKISPRRGKFRLFVKTDIYIGNSISTQELGVVGGRGSEYKEAAEKLMDKIYKLGE